MRFTFKNSTGRYPDNQIWFAIIGKKDGDTFYHATFAGGAQATITPCSPGDNTVTKNGVSYSNYFYSIDQVPTVELNEVLKSARIWIAITSITNDNPAPIYIRVISPTGIVQPSVSNPSLPDYNTLWDFMEFDYEPPKFYGNTSSVDAYGIPITLTSVGGLSPSPVGYSASRSAVFSAFQQLGSPWSDLVITGPNGPLRIVNPQNKMGPNGIQPATFPLGFWNDYVDHCWNLYSSQSVTIQSPRDTNNLYTGSVQGANFVFVKNDAPSQRYTIAKPTSAIDVFGCNGVFEKTAGEVDGDIKNQVASAINRTVLHNPNYDGWCQVSSFYQPWSGGSGSVANLYAKTLHAESISGLTYAFAYDDQCKQSTTISGDAASSAEVTVELTAF